MTYIEYMNQLWRSALLSPMPASEIALFAYLVNESNKRYWKMPFACSTTRICEDLRLSRQTVITARKHLAERKLIAFTEGKSRHLPSNYTLLEWTEDKKINLSLPSLRADSFTKELMEKKNHDYSESWRQMRVSSMTDIILMKILRLKQIEDNHGKTFVSEGVEANYSDIINYSIFALIRLGQGEEENK